MRPAQFAGVDHDRRVTERGHQARNPRAVRARFHAHGHARIPGAKRGHPFTGVGRVSSVPMSPAALRTHPVCRRSPRSIPALSFHRRFFVSSGGGLYSGLLIPTGQPFFSSGGASDRRIFFARNSLISRWRGTGSVPSRHRLVIDVMPRTVPQQRATSALKLRDQIAPLHATSSSATLRMPVNSSAEKSSYRSRRGEGPRIWRRIR